MKPVIAAVGVLFVLVLATGARAQDVVDDFSDPSIWRVVAPEGMRLTTSVDEGVAGDGLRLDYRFETGGGFGLIGRDLPMDLPENYEFSFWVRADSPDNNFEFKLLDESGESVWWVNRKAFEFPREWTRVVLPKRKFEFAWGPSGGKSLTRISGIEIAVAAANGGEGTIWLDQLEFRALKPAVPYTGTPTIQGESEGAEAAIDGDVATVWRPAHGRGEAVIDFGAVREFGGLTIEWGEGGAPAVFSIEVSDDLQAWRQEPQVRAPGAARSMVRLPDASARFVRLGMLRRAEGPLEIAEVKVEPVEFGRSTNDMFFADAARGRRGMYPKFYSREASYWTVMGIEEDGAEALMNEEGVIEPAPRVFSVHPIVEWGGRRLTWEDGRHEQSLEDGYLPIPTVTRTMEGVRLEVTAFAAGEVGASSLYARYRVTNTGAERGVGRLWLACLPYQVNPPWQGLNKEGGVGKLRSIAQGPGGVVVVNGTRRMTPCWDAEPLIAASFEAGGVVDGIMAGRPPREAQAFDAEGLASGALRVDLDLAPGESMERWIAVDLSDRPTAAESGDTLPEAFASASAPAEGAVARVEALHAATAERWRAKVGRVPFRVPPEAERVVDTFRSQLAYILINRDGPAFQPGSRSYERSWARDGSMTSAALLELGLDEEVRAWVEWFGSHQFETGKVPCVVDHRGPDPVDEHDSHGQLIWAIWNYYDHTKDAEFLRTQWPRVVKAVAFIESLRAQRMTPEYADEASPKRAYYGLVPESISHEGYSAKPMHSYWDTFFVLRGLKDARSIAAALGEAEAERKYAALVDDFRTCLYDSIRRVTKEKGLTYIPGCVELGDFDSTSTTIALFPVGEGERAPRDLLEGTFDRYWTWFQDRAKPEAVWDGYTPYELRHVGAYARLGQPERAAACLEWFFQHQRPSGWNHWAEVVFQDPETPRFIGDMPHTWVGSDYMNAVRAMFAYEREEDDAVVLFAGIPLAWARAEGGVSIERMRTRFGEVTASLGPIEGGLELIIKPDGATPPGGYVCVPPNAGPQARSSSDPRASASRGAGRRAAVLPPPGPDGSVRVIFPDAPMR